MSDSSPRLSHGSISVNEVTTTKKTRSPHIELVAAPGKVGVNHTSRLQDGASLLKKGQGIHYSALLEPCATPESFLSTNVAISHKDPLCHTSLKCSGPERLRIRNTVIMPGFGTGG